MAKRIRSKTKKLFEEAKHYLVGGVDSPVRSFGYVGGDPLLIKSGRGAKVYDYDGNGYTDYVLSWGAAILGHANPEVVTALKKALKKGLGFGTTNQLEVELARVINEAIPFIEKIRFVNSGTEAIMGAVRLARGYTSRTRILKFENSYHGHADYLLAKSGSGLATLGIPASSGVPKDFVKHTLVAPQGDIEEVERIFKRYGREIAAVLVEPAGGNYGVIPPDADFLRGLKRITKRYSALLIFDEVITAFRSHFGSSAQEFGVTPDLICLGKIIGGGLPIGSYGGKTEIMNELAPLGKVYQASTFSGNPIVMQAGLATLKILKRREKDYQNLKALTRYLKFNLEKEAANRGVDLEISYYGTMFSLKFGEKAQFRQFYRKMLEKGVFLAPSEFEANFLSFTHTRRDIEHTIDAARGAFNKM